MKLSNKLDKSSINNNVNCLILNYIYGTYFRSATLFKTTHFMNAHYMHINETKYEIKYQ